MFGGNSLKVSELCDMNSEESLYHSLIWKKISKNVNVAWYKLWKSVSYYLPITHWKWYKYGLPVTLKMSVLLEISSGKVCSTVDSNSLKMSVLLDVWKSVQYCLGVPPSMFDMNFENVFTLVW